MRNFSRRAYLAALLASSLTLAGCGVATQIADSNQKPPVTTLIAKANTDRVFTAAVQAMGMFGKVLSQDRASGVVQGQRGNWVFNTAVTPAGKGSQIQLSGRYVPSNRMDFNSRDGMTKEIIQMLETNLGEKFTMTQ